MKSMKQFLTSHYTVSVLAVMILIVGIFFPDKVSSLLRLQKLPLAVERVVQLGDVPTGKTTTRELSLFNPHLSQVTLRDVSSSCGCTVARGATTGIAPLSYGALTVSITPGRRGLGGEFIELRTNQGSQRVKIEYNAI